MTHERSISVDWPENLIALLERQQTLVDQLAGLADRQAALVEQGHTDALLGLLTQRQGVIDEFTGVQADLGRFSENLERRLQSIDERRRVRIQDLLKTIGAGLAEVMERDEKDQKTLEAARHQSKRELASLDSGRQARHAYVGSRKVTNRFADEIG